MNGKLIIKIFFIVFLLTNIWINQCISQTIFAEGKYIDRELDTTPKAVTIVDIDSDTLLDIVIASVPSGSGIAWYRNQGEGSFSSQHLIDNQMAHKIRAADMDGDGYIDVIGSHSFSPVTWYKNIDGKGTFNDGLEVTNNDGDYYDIFTVDIDNDKDIDIICDSDTASGISWFENTDKASKFTERSLSGGPVEGKIWSVHVADIDNDDNIDVFVTLVRSWPQPSISKIVWFENTDGKGNFGNSVLISSSVKIPTCISTADFDSDSDLDIIYTSRDENKIIWQDNIDGKGTFGNQKVVTSPLVHPISAYGFDLDNDGDQDILASSSSKSVWFNNLDGKGTFSQANIISDSCGNYLQAGDIDNDGDFDVVALGSNNIMWFENLTSVVCVKSKKGAFQKNFILHQNFPNPFNPKTTIKYVLHKPCRVILKIYNLSGQELETLVNEFQPKGEQDITWQVKGLPSGIYFCKLQAGEHSETKKLILQK